MQIKAREKPEETTEKKYPNLIPNSERSPEELREMGKKRDQEKTARMLADILANSPEFKARMKEIVDTFHRNER